MPPVNGAQASLSSAILMKIPEHFPLHHALELKTHSCGYITIYKFYPKHSSQADTQNLKQFVVSKFINLWKKNLY